MKMSDSKILLIKIISAIVLSILLAYTSTSLIYYIDRIEEWDIRNDSLVAYNDISTNNYSNLNSYLLDYEDRLDIINNYNQLKDELNNTQSKIKLIRNNINSTGYIDSYYRDDTKSAHIISFNSDYSSDEMLVYEGTRFEDANTNYIPIMMDMRYKGLYQLGEIIQISFFSKNFSWWLEENSLEDLSEESYSTKVLQCEIIGFVKAPLITYNRASSTIMEVMHEGPVIIIENLFNYFEYSADNPNDYLVDPFNILLQYTNFYISDDDLDDNTIEILNNYGTLQEINPIGIQLIVAHNDYNNIFTRLYLPIIFLLLAVFIGCSILLNTIFIKFDKRYSFLIVFVPFISYIIALFMCFGIVHFYLFLCYLTIEITAIALYLINNAKSKGKIGFERQGICRKITRAMSFLLPFVVITLSVLGLVIFIDIHTTTFYLKDEILMIAKNSSQFTSYNEVTKKYIELFRTNDDINPYINLTIMSDKIIFSDSLLSFIKPAIIINLVALAIVIYQIIKTKRKKMMIIPIILSCLLACIIYIISRYSDIMMKIYSNNINVILVIFIILILFTIAYSLYDYFKNRRKFNEYD